MLQQAARQRPLPNADFSARFDPTPQTQPLGPEPLLPAEIDLTPAPDGGLALRVREDRSRSLELRLSADLATALLRLLEQALAKSDWGAWAAPVAAPAPEVQPGTLN
jgi:hypothetical protein